MSSSNQISGDSLTRQRQINEWSYEEKMQTLFMMQLIFLVLLVLVASAALSSAGIITSSIGTLIGVVAFAFIFVIWVYRYAPEIFVIKCNGISAISAAIMQRPQLSRQTHSQMLQNAVINDCNR